MDQRIVDFLAKNRAAAMITLRADGTPHVVRVGIAMVDGRIWSSGTQSRARTAFLRRDPRSTLYVQDSQGPFGWLALESRVTMIEGLEAEAANLRLFRTMQGRAAPAPLTWYGRDLTEEEFLAKMREEARLVYEFEVHRAYGMTDSSGLWSATYH